MSPDLQSAVHWPRGNCLRITQINRANSSVLAGPRAQTFLISSIQSAAEEEPALGPTHDAVNASCLSVPLLAAVAEVKNPVFISLFCAGKTIPGIGPEPAWLSFGSRPGNPKANCPEQFSESSASDRQALRRDLFTYTINVFLARFVRNKSAVSENIFGSQRIGTRSRRCQTGIM